MRITQRIKAAWAAFQSGGVVPPIKGAPCMCDQRRLAGLKTFADYNGALLCIDDLLRAAIARRNETGRTVRLDGLIEKLHFHSSSGLGLVPLVMEKRTMAERAALAHHRVQEGATS